MVHGIGHYQLNILSDYQNDFNFTLHVSPLAKKHCSNSNGHAVSRDEHTAQTWANVPFAPPYIALHLDVGFSLTA